MATQITIPAALRNLSWCPSYFTAGHPIATGDKFFGVTVIDGGLTAQQVQASGISHLQSVLVGKEGDPGRQFFTADYPFDKQWSNMRRNGQGTPQQIADSQALSQQSVYFSQFLEDGLAEITDADQVYSALYQRMVTAYGVTSPNQTRLFGDYWSELRGQTFGVSMAPLKENATYMQRLRGGLADQTTARRIWDFGENNWGNTNSYFTGAGYSARNMYLNNYLDGRGRIHKGSATFGLMYKAEKAALSAPDRKAAVFGWAAYEGSEWKNFTQRINQRAYYNTGGLDGELIRLAEWRPVPFNIMKKMSLLSLLYTAGTVLWESGDRRTPDITRWTNFVNNQVYWHPTGGSQQNWNGSTPPAHDGSQPLFSTYPMYGENGGFAGAWLYSELLKAGRVGNSLEYVPFTYKVNGGSVQNGYAGGPNPVNGVLGNAKVNTFGVGNYGQHNVVDSYEADKAVGLVTVGPMGFAFVAFHEFVDPDALIEYTFNYNGAHTASMRGTDIAAFIP